MTAIHPDYFKDFRKVVSDQREEPLEIKEEKALSDLSDLAGWKVLKEFINDLKGGLDKLLSSAMENGATYEEIGQKTIVVTLAKSYLNQIIERVDDARASQQPGK